MNKSALGIAALLIVAFGALTLGLRLGASSGDQVSEPGSPPLRGGARGFITVRGAAAGVAYRPAAAATDSGQLESLAPGTGGLLIDVVDTNGAPVAGAAVRLPRDEREGRTDGAGRIAFLSLPPHGYAVAAIAALHQPTMNEVTADVFEGRLTGLTVTLAEAAPISGSVVDEQGRGISNARVNAEEICDAGGCDRHRARTRTDDAGAFLVDGLPGGNYQLEAEDEVHLDAFATTVAPSSANRIVLHPSVELAGRFVDADDQPVRGMISLSNRQTPGRSAETGADGRFDLRGLPAGKYQLGAYETAEGQNTRHREYDLELNHSMTDYVVALPAGGSISGTVVDEQGHPLSRALVDCEPMAGADAGGRSFVDREDGTFTVVGLQSGAYRLTASHDGFEASPAAEARPGAQGVVLQLKSGSGVHGRVVGPNGLPITTFKVDGVEVEDARGELSRPYQPGDLELEIEAEGMAPKLVTAHVEPRSTVELGDIHLGTGLIVHGQVLDASGQPVVGARVMTRADADAWDDVIPRRPRGVPTDSQGRFALPHLAEGTEIVAEADGFDRVSAALPDDGRAMTLVVQREGADAGLARGPR